MAELDEQSLLHIKKYPNRRYYDTTRSCHVTLKEVHTLVVGGRDVCITDSRTGDDITNLVLMQIVIEKDQPKLDLFPASVMHMMVRANRQALRGYVDQFFSPFLGAMARSRNQFDSYMRRMMSGQFVSPAEWGNYLAQAIGSVPGGSPAPEAGGAADDSEAESPEAEDTRGDGSPGDRSVEDRPPEGLHSAGRDAAEPGMPPPYSQAETADALRDQLAELTRRIEALSDQGTPKPT